MKTIIRAVCAIGIAGLVISQCPAEQVLPVLNTVSQTYTNVTVLSVTDTHLFFRYAGGEESVKLKDLSPELQKEFGYKPSNETQVAPVTQVQVHNTENTPETPTAPLPKKGSLDEVAAHDFRLNDGTKLRLTYPKYWARTTDSATGEEPIIRLKHPYPDNFQVLVALMPKNNPFAKLDTYTCVELPGNYSLRDAVETNLLISAIEGPEVKGHYFGLTLKNHRVAAPAECEGMVKLADMQLCFSVLCDDWKSLDAQAAIEMMRTAHLVSKAEEKQNQTVP